MRNFKNNAIAKLKLPLSSSSKLIVLEDGHGEKFPTSNFKGSVVKFDENEKVLRREIVEIETRTGDRLEVKNRAFEETPRSDGSPTSEKTAFNFDVGDVFINSVFASDFKDIETRFEENEVEIGNKLNISDESVTKEGNTFNIPNKLLKLDENGKLPELDGSKLINLTSNPFFLGNGNDGSLTVANGETKVLEGNRIYNFSDVNIEGGGILTINENTGNLYIKCTGKFINNGLIDGNNKNHPEHFSPIFSFLSQVKSGIPGVAGNGGEGGPYSQNTGRPGGKGGEGKLGFGGGGGGGVVSSVTSGTAMGKAGEDGPSSKGGEGGRAGSSYPGGAGGQTYGENGSNGTGGGGGGADGESGKSGVNIIIYASEILGSGTISLNGSNGGNGGTGGNSGQYKYGGGGGGGGGAGGAGGSILIISKNSHTFNITNTAGTGGKGGYGGSYGGKTGTDGLGGSSGEIKYIKINDLGAETSVKLNTGESMISKISGSGTSFSFKVPDDAIKVIFSFVGGQCTLYKNKITNANFVANGRSGNTASWSGEYLYFSFSSGSTVDAYFFK